MSVALGASLPASPAGAAGRVVAPTAASPSPLAATATLVIVGVALLRLLTAQVALPVFDLDPMLVVGGQAGVAPGPSLFLDALVLFSATLGLAAERAAGRRVDGVLVVLALLPTVPLAATLGGPIENLWRGMTWLSSIVGAVALCHLLRDRGLRRMALAMLLAGLTIVAVRGVTQILIEHPRTVATYALMREQFIADRGWNEESASVRVFENRLGQREATGWFGLSNVFSSAMTALGLLGFGLFAAARRSMGERLPRMAGWLLGVGLAACGLILFNGSKGAILSLALGAAVLALGALRRPLPWSAGPMIALGLPLLALAAVVVRGAALPADLGGERSLLFRWHYLVDAAAILARHPLLGVGPDGFQQAMVAVRPPWHPEEVASAHNVGADWLASFGVLGGAWIVLLVVLLCRAGGEVTGPGQRQAAADAERARLAKASAVSPPACCTTDSGRLPLIGLLLVALGALWLESATLDPLLLLLRLAGIVAAVLAMAAAATALDMQEAAGEVGTDRGHEAAWAAPARWAVFAAAVAVVTHAQIEMTFWLSGSLPWVMVLLALAAPAPSAPKEAQAGPGRWVALLPAAVAVVPLLWGWMAWSNEATMRRAAAPLEQLGLDSVQVRDVTGQITAGRDATARPALLDALAAALRSAGAPSETAHSIVSRLAEPGAEDRAIAVRTLTEALGDLEASARLKAAAWLAPAAEGRDLRPIVVLAEQCVRSAAVADMATREQRLRGALAMVDRAVVRGSRLGRDHRLLRARAELLEALAASGDPGTAEAAAHAWSDLVERDPWSIALRKRAAAAAARIGDLALERAELERILEIDQALGLYPRRQLTPEQRAEIQARLKVLRSQG